MFSIRSTSFVCGLTLLVGCFSWQIAKSGAQQPTASDKQSKPTDARFEFEIVESHDAEYLGDTPGHHGRNGGLGSRRPQLALGDPVFRGDEQVGTLTHITWDRTGGSLDLEFDPAPLVRVNVGDVVWVALDGTKAQSTTSADKSTPPR